MMASMAMGGVDGLVLQLKPMLVSFGKDMIGQVSVLRVDVVPLAHDGTVTCRAFSAAVRVNL